MSFIRSVRRTAGMTLAGIVAVAITGWLLTHGSAKTDTAARGTAHVQLDRIAAAPIRSGPRLRAGPGRTRRTAGQDRRRRGRQRLVRLAGEQAPAIRSGLADGTVKRAPTTATELAAPLTLTVTLRRSDQPGFERFLSAVTDPKSPDFRHFLSQRVLTARFGPSRSAYRSVKRWLTASGFRLLRGSANRLTLTVRGTRARVDRAFDLSLGEFRLHRRNVFATDRDPAVPARLAQSIEAVVGLSSTASPLIAAPIDEYVKSNLHATNPMAGTLADSCWQIELDIGVLLPTSGEDGVEPATAGYQCAADELDLISTYVSKLGSQVLREHARRVSPLIGGGSPPGAGEKIGLLELDSFSTSDVADLLALEGLPASNIDNLSETDVDGGTPVVPGVGESEVLLDIDAAMSLAPGAQVEVFDAPISSTDFVDEFNAMINAGVTVISNSWAACEDQVSQSDADAIDSVLQQAAASGISVLTGSGDSGSTCLDGSPNTVAVPADSPNVTAVGGTSATPGVGGTYGSETYWNGTDSTPETGSGGFGVSKYFPAPSYQSAYSTASGRSVPDVALNADPVDGYQICQADAGGCPDGLLYGGTSAATPVFAALVADVDEQVGGQLGELNPLLYSLGNTDAFHPAASMSSDFAHVGLGSPNLDRLALAIEGASPGPVSATVSSATAEPVASVPADGSTADWLVVTLTDASGNTIAGKDVTLSAGTHTGDLTMTPARGTTTDDNGAVVFEVTDTVPETVSFTATDTTDGVTLSETPLVTFVAPAATGGEISVTPSVVPNDGTSTATINVYLQNALGQPAVGKTVSLAAQPSPFGDSAVIAPASGQAVTGSDGVATFTVTDTAAESVPFLATDVTDGNLPVPGSAVVSFQPETMSPCSFTAATPESGYSVVPYASGFITDQQPLSFFYGNGFPFFYGGCGGAEAPTFDSSGNMLSADGYNGAIYDLGTAAANPSPANALPDSPFQGGGELGSVVYGSDGTLYAGQWRTGINFSDPQLLQLNPATGAIQQVLLSTAQGMPVCPVLLADPISGNLLVLDGCSGGLSSPDIYEISNPDSSDATVSTYATLSSTTSQGVFAADGTLWVASGGELMSVSGTNTANPGTVTPVDGAPAGARSVAIAATNEQGQATALYVVDTTGIERVDLTTAPVTVTTIATGGIESNQLGEFGPTSDGGNVFTAPDGCLFNQLGTTIYEITGPGTCSASAAQPTLSLVDDTPGDPATGSSASFTATLSDVSGASGTPVHFDIVGANSDAALADADSAGAATFSYPGTFPGVDAISAWALINGTIVSSAPVAIHWVAGKDLSALSMNASQESGATGQPATLAANLVDLSQTPTAAIGGATVTLSLAGQSCTTTTDGSGNASCSVTPTGAAGLDPVTASYAGDSTHTASSAVSLFAVGGIAPSVLTQPMTPITTTPTTSPTPVGVPVNTTLPAITGSPEAGGVLSCSNGSWSRDPTKFAFQWARDGTALTTATTHSYTIQALDEGSTLTCAVTASNATGSSAPATSAAVKIRVPHIAGCPAATGTVTATKLGQITLGITPQQARRAYSHSTTRGRRYEDFFCLTPIGIRVGYASPKLLTAAPRRHRKHLAGRVVWASTSDPFYAINGIRPGATLAAAESKLPHGNVFHIGLNTWYLAPYATATAVFKVRQNVVEEIGVAERQVTPTRTTQRVFLTSFS